jgi:gliding motility-associated-like protein
LLNLEGKIAKNYNNQLNFHFMKKIFLLFLMGFISFSGFAQLDEDFEAAPATPDASGVWGMTSGNWLVTDNRTQSLPNWEVNPQATYPANGGVKAAFINRENTGPGVLAEEWLISPLVNVTDVNRQIRFFTRQTLTGDDGSAVYQVRISSDPNQANLAAYTVLIEYTETQLSTITPSQLDYEEKIINLTGISGNRYIAFVKVCTQPANQTSGDRWLIDDVHIVERCLEPTTFGITDVSAYNGTLIWVGNAASYTIEYGPSGFTPGTGTIVTNIPDGGATDSYIIPLQADPPGPLTPDTAYQFYVTSVCPTSVSQQTGPFNFTTSPLGSTCDGPIVVTPLPYFDTGDTIQQGNNINFPSPGGTGCGTTGDFLNGNDVVYAYTVPATTTGLISIDMNPLGTPNTGVFVYNDCASIGSNCLAGVGNNNSNVRSIPALVVIPGQTYYIVVSSTGGTFPYNITIQDVTCAPPTGLSATGTGPNSANLSWQNPGSATAWEVFVQTAGSSIPSTPGIPANTNVNFGVTQLTQEGTTLQLGTPYQYWVRALCPDGVSYSQWAGPYLFNTTSCSSGCNYIFELTDAFGDGWNGNTMNIIQDGLTIAVIGPTFTDGTGPIQISVPMCDGPFEIFWNAGGNFIGEVGVSVINSFGQNIFSFGPNQFEQNITIYNGVVDCANPLCLPPTAVSFSSPTTNGVTIDWTPNGPPPVSWDILVIPASDPAPDASTPITANTTSAPPYLLAAGLLPDTEYVIYVRAVCSTPGSNPWSNPSDPFFTLPTCPKPTGLFTQNADLTSIEFGWIPGLSETAWQYIVLPSPSTPPLPDDPAWTDTTSNPVTIDTNLNSGTAYDFYVRAVCDADDISTISGPFTSNTTICAASEQCPYTFTLTDSFGDGWNGNTMNIIQNGVVVATIGSQLEDGTGPVDVTIPLCHGVSFEIFWNEGGNFAGEVGLAVTSFLGQNIFTHTPGNSQQGQTLYSGTAECTAPTCIAPTGVLVTSTSLDTATITWTENNTPPVGTWNVLVQASNLPPPAQDATGWVVANTNNPFIYGDLDPATSYTVYVRSVCSDTDNSFWSQGYDFATQICAPADVCDYIFTMTDSFGDGWNGNTMTILQSGIPVATIGADFTDGTGPIQQVITLCNNIGFEVFWNEGGNFATEVGLTIQNASATEVFSHAPGNNEQGTTLFSGTVNCVPATCPKPVQLYVQNVDTDSAELGWTESGSSTQWEVIILPAGSPIPAPDAVGIITSDNPYTAALTSGTSYVFYVRAICGPGDVSNWAGPKAFATMITNDECDTSVDVPVNPDQSCAQFASGTIIGATASSQPNDCGGTADDDVWFQFTAVTSAHNINLTNINGSTEDLFHIVYQSDGGTCGNLTQLYCSDNNESIATGLIPGQVYFIRVFSWTGTPGQTSTFDICIGTIPPPISSSTTSHTPVQLIEDVLLNTTCASVSNVTFSTGTNFGSENGIGYFESNGSSFPFDYGVVLTTGNADSAPGPNTSNLGDGTDAWPGDPDLTQILADAGIPTGTLGNATSLEFDFVPLTNAISFDFIFASEEYGTFQCGFSDVFGFLLTNTVTNETTNLAVIPSTNIPISVTTIRNNLYNGGCDSANEAYFGTYYEAPEGQPLDAPINFNGVTIPMTASASVTPGVTYHIKLAIADYTASEFFQDNVFDSAVFLKGGSFGIGNIELGDNLLEENGGALCVGGSIELNSSLNPAEYSFIWYLGDDVIPDATGATLVVNQEGTYTVQATLNNSTCTGTDSIVVEYYNPVAPGAAPALTICDSATTGVFDLTANSAAITAPIGNNYTLTYFLTEQAAIDNIDGTDIDAPTTYTNISNPQTIYVRAQNNTSGCFGVTSFQLILQDLTPQFTLPADFSICSGTSGTIAVTPINFDLAEATYSWTWNTNPLPDVTSSITVSQAGFYEVTVNHSGCTATMGVNVSVDTQITPAFNFATSVCQNTTAPVLPTTSINSVTGTWSPATVDTSLSGTVNYCFTPGAGQTCAVQFCTDITVNPEVTPLFDPIPTLCVGTAAPSLPTTSLNGVTGTWSAAISTGVPGTFPITFTPNASQLCALPVNITVTVLPAGQVPDFAQLGPICSGTNLTLPVTSINGITGVWTPAVSNTATTTYTFDPNPGQCAVQTTMTVVVNTIVEPGFEPIGPLCQLTAGPTLATTSPTGITGTWNPSVINTDNAGTTAVTFTPDAGQCANNQTLSINIISQPEFMLSGGCVGPEYVLTVAPGSNFGSDATYTWTDSSNNPIPGANEASLVVTATGTYHLTVASGTCSFTEDILVTTVSCGIQKGISPGDGTKNDFFDLAGLNVRRLEIFNRYGTKVYSQSNYSREWYGQSDKGDELPDGTYYYVIERDTETKTGWIYINRVK